MKWKPLAPRPSRLVSALSEPNSPNITKHEIGPPLFDEEQRLWLASLLRKAKSRATSAEIAQFVEAVAASVVQWHLASTMPPAATARQVHNALRQFWILASEPEPAIGLIKARLRALPSEAVSAMEVRGRLLWPSIFKAKLPPCGLIGWSKTAAPADLVQGLRLITANGAAAVAGRSRLNGRQSRPSLEPMILGVVRGSPDSSASRLPHGRRREFTADQLVMMLAVDWTLATGAPPTHGRSDGKPFGELVHHVFGWFDKEVGAEAALRRYWQLVAAERRRRIKEPR